MPSTTPRKRPRANRGRPLRSIVDLIGGSSRADAALGDDAPDDAWTSFVHTIDNLATRSLPARDSLSGQTSNPAHAEGNAEVEGVPHDRTLKTALRVTSPNTLAWTRFRGQGEEYSALAAYVAGRENGGPPVGSDAASSPERALTDARRRFYKGLLHFRHPLDSGPLAARWQAGLAGRDADVAQRMHTWQASLQSLFYGFKHRLVPEFYVILSSTIALFTRAPDPIIWFSRGTPGVRSLLSEHCVDFRVQGEAEDPCVIVEGEQAVQAAYSFVFSAGPKLSGANDVPPILADFPFRGGAVVSAEIGIVGEAAIVEEEGSRFSVTISGLLLPRQVEDIAEALRVTQGGNFAANIETEKRGRRLNECAASKEDGVENGMIHEALPSGVIAKISMEGGEQLISLVKDSE